MPQIRIVECATEDFRALLGRRAPGRDPDLERAVAQIIEDVRLRGDEALLEQAQRFDSPDVQVVEFRLDKGTIPVVTAEREAIATAYGRIFDFHLRQMEAVTSGWEQGDQGWTWSLDNERIGQWMKPLQRVGIYVPGGFAAYPSSTLMLAGPARAAQVGEIFCCSPAMSTGKPNMAVLAALGVAGVDRLFMAGGAGAIAAMALGTESVPRVDKIVGPGNRFVNEAKRQLWGTVGLDGYAGPSEVCVLADDTANATFAAVDLLTQVEHAPDNAGFLVCLSRAKLDEILSAAEELLTGAKREGIMREALAKQSLAFVARDLHEALDIVNRIAPEHLSLAVKDPDPLLGKINAAGCVLLGEWTPESAADYVLGPSHTLPTSGAARFSGPVNVLDFLKIQSFAHLDRGQLAALTPTIEVFGAMEDLPIHAKGAVLRFGTTRRLVAF